MVMQFTRHNWHWLVFIALSFVIVTVVYTRQQDAFASAVTRQELILYGKLAIIEELIIIEQTRHILSILEDFSEIKGGDSTACNEIMARLIKPGSRYVAAGAANLSGEVWCSGAPFTDPINITDRAYFQRAIASGGFSVGDYQVGRVSRVPSLTFAYPVRNEAGGVQSVIFLSVGLSWLDEFKNLANLPPGAVMTLIDNNGTVLARHPNGTEDGVEAPEVSYALKNVTSVQEGFGEVEVYDLEDKSHYMVVAPLQREQQEGFIHLIISIPKEEVDF